MISTSAAAEASCSIGQDKTQHPLSMVLLYYYTNFLPIKQANEDLNNITFHKTFGLYIDCPTNWPYISAVKNTVELAAGKLVTLVYSSTRMYKDLYESLGDDVKYISWHEINTAMSRVSEDTRYLNQIKEQLIQSGLIVFMVASQSLVNVIDLVRMSSDNCLIILG